MASPRAKRTLTEVSLPLVLKRTDTPSLGTWLLLLEARLAAETGMRLLGIIAVVVFIVIVDILLRVVRRLRDERQSLNTHRTDRIDTLVSISLEGH
jgi:hypothetical protein